MGNVRMKYNEDAIINLIKSNVIFWITAYPFLQLYQHFLSDYQHRLH